MRLSSEFTVQDPPQELTVQDPSQGLQCTTLLRVNSRRSHLRVNITWLSLELTVEDPSSVYGTKYNS